uniref:Arginine vasopressin-induced protein 1 n=1 Tax=Poecilia mexicana TaxID=48701 RepID=A0A3B3XE51_9TELE
MAEASEVSSIEDGLPAEWKPSSRRSRKSGCSNIFSGVNLHQLHRLFRTAGDRNAEHRAKLVCNICPCVFKMSTKKKTHKHVIGFYTNSSFLLLNTYSLKELEGNNRR